MADDYSRAPNDYSRAPNDDRGRGGARREEWQGFRDRVESAADAQKQRAADSMGSAAQAARDTGQRMRGEHDFLASWIGTAADQVQLFADRLRDRRPGELLEDLERFARQRPAMFLGAAFVLGVATARLLKSAPPGSGDGDWNRGGGYASRGQAGSGRASTGANDVAGASGEWSPHAVS